METKVVRFVSLFLLLLGGSVLLSPETMNCSLASAATPPGSGAFTACFQGLASEPICRPVGRVWTDGLLVVEVYSKEVRLGHRHLQGQVLLELGDARTVAEVFVNGKRAGIRMSRPFRFDISDFVQPGNNQIQVKVANTLANHMSSYPTHWVLEDQAVSGLLGPEQLRFHSRIKLSATVLQ